MEKKIKPLEQRRKSLSFKLARFLVKLLYHKPKFRYLGEEFVDGPFLFIVNHCGSNVPTRIECYFPRDFYMWGTHEMTEGLKAVKYYLIHIYYHQKKHMPIFFAYIIGTLFALFANAFYKGLRLIPTYTDSRIIKTVNESYRHVSNGKALVIYPEDSSHGYQDQIEKFYSGFVAFCEVIHRKNIDLPIYVAHYVKNKKEFIVDKMIRFSTLKEKFNSLDSIADYLRLRMNALVEQ